MFLLIALIGIFLCLLLIYFGGPLILRNARLRKEYESITFLTISSIPFVGNAHQLGKTGSEFYQLMLRLSEESQQKNKGIFCLWFAIRPVMFISSGDGLEKFINHSKQLVKSRDYECNHPWLKTGLLNSKNEKWRSRRRLITPSFHDNQLLQNFIAIFNEQARVLADRFLSLATSKQTHNLYPHISACTLDIITEAATGTRVDAQVSGGDNSFIQATMKMSEIVTTRIRCPWLWPDIIFNHLPIGHEQRRALNILHGFSRKVIQERIATFDREKSSTDSHRHRLVFLDSLIAQMHTENLSLDDIQEEVDTFMFEGHDTTATAVTFFCYLMGCYPDVQKKVQEEFDTIFGDDHERDCTMDDIQKMTYLDRVIKEAMRILPPVPWIGREAQEDFYFRDQLIRKGTTVNIAISGIHRDSRVFPNPDVFDPSRFEENTIINEQRSPFAFIPFSAGSRNCIGQRFANMEERVILSTLFRRFSFRSTQKVDELRLTPEMVLRTEVPIMMFVEDRSKSLVDS